MCKSLIRTAICRLNLRTWIYAWQRPRIWVIKTVQLSSQLKLIYGVVKNKLACELLNKTANRSGIDRWETSAGWSILRCFTMKLRVKILCKSTSICQFRVDFELPHRRSKVYLLKHFSINLLNHRNCKNTGSVETVASLMRLESERQ